MIEKVNPMHPDKLADRIAGARVDYAYTKAENPKVAVEVLIGHGKCHVIIETSEDISYYTVKQIVNRIAGDMELILQVVEQDKHLADNQSERIRCGDNGIFRGVPLTEEQIVISDIARDIYHQHPSDGKYILAKSRLIVCQSNADSAELYKELTNRYDNINITVNPLGDWTGGTDVDSGATNRKLGSDMADSVTGGGLHGKDLSKADVSVNIYAFRKAQETGKPVELYCAIGDDVVDGVPYEAIVEQARQYIKSVGGFEKFAEWGLF